MKRIGIFGGSFDPIHEAHISLAQYAQKECFLDEILFVPAKLQPFKLNNKVTAAEDRLQMARLAVEGIADFSVSDYEINNDGVSYSYLTMRAMQANNENASLFFITGTDAFLMIEKWREATELLTNYSFIIGTRPGYKESELNETIERIRAAHGTEIIKINNIQIDISSTEIRNLIANGKSIKGLVPEKVEEYINDKTLYR